MSTRSSPTGSPATLRTEAGQAVSALRQLSLLFALYLLAVWVCGLLPFAFPASVLGMLLLLLLLLAGVVKPRQVERGADLLLQNMMFLFVPAGVSILEYFSLIRDKVPVLILIALVTLAVTLAATAFTVKAAAALLGKRREAKR